MEASGPAQTKTRRRGSSAAARALSAAANAKLSTTQIFAMKNVEDRGMRISP
jgi:hypothetical protein